MVGRISRTQLAAQQEVVTEPNSAEWVDHNFEMPPALYFISGALFLGFVAVLSLAFASPKMAVVFGVCVAFIVTFFTVPTVFVRASPEAGASARRWDDFIARGIATEHGRCGGREAALLVLVLPVAVFCWGLAIAAIVALI